MAHHDASEIADLIKRWFAAYSHICFRMFATRQPKTEKDWARYQVSLNEDRAKLRELSEQLAVFAESVEISSDPYWALVGNFDGATDATWDAAQALTKRLSAKAKAMGAREAASPAGKSQGEGGAPKAAPQIITGKVAEQRYHVTRKTIREHVNKLGTLTDYRPSSHADNAELLVDEREIAAKWQARLTK